MKVTKKPCGNVYEFASKMEKKIITFNYQQRLNRRLLGISIF